MTTKSQWHAANRALMSEDRQRLGDPPSAEEVLAYTRGELPAHEAARISERLVAYPDLVRTLTTEFPVDPATPGDPDYMSDDEFAEHWASLQKRMPGKGGGRVVQFWPAVSAIAATLAIVFGALFWQERAERMRPRVEDQQDLRQDGSRGIDDNAVTLQAQGESFLLVLRPPPTAVYDSYRLEIVSPTPERSLWTSEKLPWRADDIPILVHRSFFKSGKYQVVLYGESAGREERVSTYSLRVPGR
jgi:hypothetical protein